MILSEEKADNIMSLKTSASLHVSIVLFVLSTTYPDTPFCRQEHRQPRQHLLFSSVSVQSSIERGEESSYFLSFHHVWSTGSTSDLVGSSRIKYPLSPLMDLKLTQSISNLQARDQISKMFNSCTCVCFSYFQNSIDQLEEISSTRMM